MLISQVGVFCMSDEIHSLMSHAFPAVQSQMICVPLNARVSHYSGLA